MLEVFVQITLTVLFLINISYTSPYRFGKGPYYVKFVINQKITEEIQYFFVIEIPYRKELPHSIYTFLTLVESNLYNNGAAFLSARDGGFQIVNNSNNGVHGGGVTLEHKLKPLVRNSVRMYVLMFFFSILSHFDVVCFVTLSDDRECRMDLPSVSKKLPCLIVHNVVQILLVSLTVDLD